MTLYQGSAKRIMVSLIKESSELTIDFVVKAGLCTGCGTCAGICPRNAVEMVMDCSKGIYLPRLEKERCSQCGICLEACPGHFVDFKQLNFDIFGEESRDSLVGNYFDCYTSYATNYEVRYDSASGGVVTALLIFALDMGLIDGALVTKMNTNKPLEPQPFIARTKEEIVSAATSKYCPVATNMALREILSKEGKYAVVGLPCHMHGLRKAASINIKLQERIVLYLGLFCSHTPSFSATEYLLFTKKLRKEDVMRLRYRGEGWPGFMTISSEKGDFRLPQHDYWASGFGSYFHPIRCSLCCDQSSELADISFGDAWLPELAYDKIGRSMIISRSRRGKEILQRAVLEGAIELEPIPVQKVVESQWESMILKKNILSRFTLCKLAHRQVPSYTTSLLKPNFRGYLSGVLLFCRIYIGSKKFLWRMIYVVSLLNLLPLKVLRITGLYERVAPLRRKMIRRPK